MKKVPRALRLVGCLCCTALVAGPRVAPADEMVIFDHKAELPPDGREFNHACPGYRPADGQGGRGISGGGAVVEGELRPSSDTPTHLALYRAFEAIGGVAHTHSLYATAWAQAQRDIPPLGTTHADHFAGAIPCTRPLKAGEIAAEYEANTGKVIVERLAGCNPLHFPAVLVACHRPFAWGLSPEHAVENAAAVERIARLASETIRVEPYPRAIHPALLKKHFLRKHGPNSYYGQDGQTKS